MNPDARRLVVSVAAAVMLAGCKEPAADVASVPDARAAERAAASDVSPAKDVDPIDIGVSCAATTVTLGDDVIFRVRISNRGESAASVATPRIDESSAAFQLRRADGSVVRIGRRHGALNKNGVVVSDAPQLRRLAPGESFTTDVAVVAVEAGRFGCTMLFASPTVETASAASDSSPRPAPQAQVMLDRQIDAGEIDVVAADPAKPRLGVTLDTTHGAYTAVFRPDVAFDTVESFASLVKKGFYSGVKFHRIIRSFMAQGGDPSGTGEGGPGYFLPLEAHPEKLPHRRGVMSMARTAIPDTAGSQFFIMFATRPDLDEGRYATFAEMVEGEGTLAKIEAVPVGKSQYGEPSVPKAPVEIRSARLVMLP